MSSALGLAAVTVLAATVIQAATGFGFALIAGPALFALVEPVEAVGLISVFGLVSNVLVLAGERSRLTIERQGVVVALVAAVAGLPIGAVAVSHLSREAMSVAVGVVVVALVAVRLARPRRAGRLAPPTVAGTATGAIAAGFAAGVLTTSTTTSGPPLAIWLTGRGLKPTAIRDTACAFYLVLGAIGIGVLVAVSGTRVFGAARWLPLLLPLVVAGQLVGRRATRRLSGTRFEQLVITVAVGAALAGLLRAVL